MSDLLERIKHAVEATLESATRHTASVPLVETFRGQTVWEGTVEVFETLDSPSRVAYGWAVESDSGPRFVTVLNKPPVTSPITAVRAWIVSEAKAKTP